MWENIKYYLRKEKKRSILESYETLKGELRRAYLKREK